MPLLRKKSNHYSYWTIVIASLCFFLNDARCQPAHFPTELIQQQTASSTKEIINNGVYTASNLNSIAQNKQKNVSLKTRWKKWQASILTKLMSYRLVIARKHQKLLANRVSKLKSIYLQLLQLDNKKIVIALKQFITVTTIAHNEYQLNNLDQRINQLTQRLSKKNGTIIGKNSSRYRGIDSNDMGRDFIVSKNN